MDLWHDIETGPKIPSVINVIVEIPKGSQNKYEYDKKRGVIKLDRVPPPGPPARRPAGPTAAPAVEAGAAPNSYGSSAPPS